MRIYLGDVFSIRVSSFCHLIKECGMSYGRQRSVIVIYDLLHEDGLDGILHHSRMNKTIRIEFHKSRCNRSDSMLKLHAHGLHNLRSMNMIIDPQVAINNFFEIIECMKEISSFFGTIVHKLILVSLSPNKFKLI